MEKPAVAMMTWVGTWSVRSSFDARERSGRTSAGEPEVLRRTSTKWIAYDGVKPLNGPAQGRRTDNTTYGTRIRGFGGTQLSQAHARLSLQAVLSRS